MTNILTRAFSALTAAAILVTVLTLFDISGATFLVVLVAALIAAEISLLFSDSKLQAVQLSLLSASSLLVHFFAEAIFNSYLIYFFAIALVPWFCRNKKIEDSYQALSAILFSFFYCFLTPIYVFSIMDSGEGFLEFYFFIVLVFGTDTMAYLFGKLFGHRFVKASFQPKISPSKTFEGLAGALLWPFLLCGLAQYFKLVEFSAFSFLLIMITTFVAISGDLIASLIKRNFNKKDTSHLMPGHGGLLDRLDSLLLSSPFYFWALSYLSF